MSRTKGFFDSLPFEPDRFQREAADVIEAGESVVVTAPTGAGKTLVAETAVHLARANRTRAFYTTPLKALSNQKFADFRRDYGDEAVGLLTGDNSVNPDASIVVMTTEVLRNMIYVDSNALRDLGVVILDEVHYLQDRFRGMVWEEIIIHLPRKVPLVCLSATVSNASDFTAWVRSRRGPTRLVAEHHRPVPLESLYLVQDRHHGNEAHLLPVFVGGGGRSRPNEQIDRLLRPGRPRHGRYRTPRRNEVAELLATESLLPAIYFVFSRAGCDAAAERVASSALRLTSRTEAGEIRDAAERRTAHIAPRDLAVLGYDRWLSMLQAGVAPHHAGHVPAFKETVEELFLAGLVKLVFATETLSLGINMPARTVVLESLSKFTGESHELLRPGDYTQLTGRAGRRGIDTRGTAIVLFSQFVPFERVAAIAGAGSHALVSSFRPNYNMAVNMIANYSQDEAEQLLAASFGHFQRVQQQERIAEEISSARAELEAHRRAAECDRGDIWQFLDAERDGTAGATHGTIMRAFVRELEPGDVIEKAAIMGGNRAVMLARGLGSNPRMLILSDEGKVRRIKPEQLGHSATRVGVVALPEPFRPRDTTYQRQVVRLLRAWEPRGGDVLAAYGPGDGVTVDPVASCPDLPEHRASARRAGRAERRLERLDTRQQGPGGKAMLAEFRANLDLLKGWGYVDGWGLTAKGERLRFVYNELDLLVVESASAGHLSSLMPEELASLVSVFVYDPRAEVVPGRFATDDLTHRWLAIDQLAQRLGNAEEDHRLPRSRAPEPGFAELGYYWATGADLDDLLDDDDVAGGDFVRTCRQLIDLLLQLRDAFPELAETAAAAAKAIDRGVVAAGGME